MCLPKIEIKRAILKTPQGRFNECGLKQVWQSILCFSFCLFATQRCDLCVKEEKGKNVWKPPTLKRCTFMKTYWGNVIIQVVFFCTSRPHSTDSATHRKMTLSLADRCSKTQKIRILPMAGRDPESHRNEMIKVARAVRCGNSFVTTETGRVRWGQLLTGTMAAYIIT